MDLGPDYKPPLGGECGAELLLGSTLGSPRECSSSTCRAVPALLCSHGISTARAAPSVLGNNSVGTDEEGEASSAPSGQCCVLGFPVLRECSLLLDKGFSLEPSDLWRLLIPLQCVVAPRRARGAAGLAGSQTASAESGELSVMIE